MMHDFLWFLPETTIICQLDSKSKFLNRENNIHCVSRLSAVFCECEVWGLMRCYKCKKNIPDENLRCFYCGSLLDVHVGPLSFIANSHKRWIIVAIAVILILLILSWYF